MHREFFRLLLNPVADPGGGSPPPAPPAPAPPAPGPTVPPAPAPSPGPQAPPPAPSPGASAVTLTGADLARWQAEQAELARFRQQQADADTQRRAQEIQDLTRRGNFEEIARLREADLRAAQQRAEQAEVRVNTFAVRSELAAGLAGYRFVDSGDGEPSWAEDLIERFQGQFVPYPVGNSLHVRHRDGRTVREFLAAEMRKPKYQGILAAEVAGGPVIGDLSGRGAGGPVVLPNTPAAREFHSWSVARREADQAGGNMFGVYPRTGSAG